MVKWVKRNILRWFGQVRGMNEDDFVKKMYEGRYHGKTISEMDQESG